MTRIKVVKRLSVFLVAAVLAASILVSCKKPEARQGPVDLHAGANGSSAEPPQDDAIVVKDEYVSKTEAKLDGLDERVKELKENAKRAGALAQSGIDDKLSSLDNELESARRELMEISKSDHETDEIRSRLNNRIEEIDKALSDTVASIR